MNKHKFEAFNVSQVALEGSNLIEASAGTGKTYSIGILVLRVILEEKIHIRQILMVTFTKAAVVELEERIRLFIRLANRSANNERINDELIVGLVTRAIKDYGEDYVRGVLKDAVAYLDEISVLTIHSFCQQTLNEFAFETKQLYGSELLQDISTIREEEVNKFWRKYITTIPVDLLIQLGELSRKNILEIIKQHLDGKRFSVYDHSIKYDLCEDDHSSILSKVNEVRKKELELKETFIAHIKKNQKQLKEKSANNTYAKKNILDHIDHPEKFIESIKSKRTLVNIIKVFQAEILMCEDCEKIEKQRKEIVAQFVDKIYCVAISEVTAGIKKHKQFNNQLSFDDLIANLHTALVKHPNPRLVGLLKKKYKAVFIDEFQDTDKLQYEIFKTAFGRDSIVFYIGDPKQSIYAWRKADIHTYLKAYDDVSHLYGMNENFRSSEYFINAMNLFFQPTPDFNTFNFPSGDHAIKYIPVNSPSNNNKGHLSYKNEPCVTISINRQANKESIPPAVAAQVIELLSDYTLSENGTPRNIHPSDIGILVRSHREVSKIKSVLARYGIPAVTIDDTKVLKSDEAIAIQYLLEAMIDISRSSINRALLSPFTGYSVQNIIDLDDEKALELFKKYRTNWDKDGVYTALINFISDFGIHQALLEKNSESGKRTITNLYQLIELLYKIQSTKKLSPQELIDWLKRAIEKNVEGDEYEQRVENDDDCVNIVTIHKSKGLEYNIVLAPHLDFTARDDDFKTFRDSATGEYINVGKSRMTDSHVSEHSLQSEQENRRLVYVAITRAVYKCYIYKNDSGKAVNSTLSTFLKTLTNPDPSVIEFLNSPLIAPGYFYRANQNAVASAVSAPVNFHLMQTSWSRMSYTMLSADLEKAVIISSGVYPNKYDNFIFNQLVKGNITGNMLHFIFENLHFTNSQYWSDTINTAIIRFAPKHAAIYTPGLLSMIEHVMAVSINAGEVSFNLAEVAYEKRIHEFEFDFPVSLFHPDILQDLSDENITINVKSRSELEGIMNGKIDMLFECKGKYFVLDWKSTFLGDSVEDYSPAALAAAMNDNNYHLQYLIYTLATKKYLESRVPGFNYERDFGGVLYLFVRGMRKGSENGVFYCKPQVDKIKMLQDLLQEKRLA